MRVTGRCKSGVEEWLGKNMADGRQARGEGGRRGRWWICKDERGNGGHGVRRRMTYGRRWCNTIVECVSLSEGQGRIFD